MNTTYLDVRLPGDHQAEHIPGSLNNPVFEVQFNERIAKQFPDKNVHLTIYGYSRSSREAVMAAEKLHRMGYPNVHLLQDGFTGWKSEGKDTEKGSPPPPPPEAPTGSVPVDCQQSEVIWTGRNLLNKHTGTVGIDSGTLTFENGHLTEGEIVLNLMDLRCTDLAGSDLHDVLIAHLQNDDFFDVERYPLATLQIFSTHPTGTDSPGAPNLHIDASLNLRGHAHRLEFSAATGVTDDGRAAAQASFAIDRTRWGVLYGSGKFFDRLAGHLVNDLVEFDVKIVTSK